MGIRRERTSFRSAGAGNATASVPYSRFGNFFASFMKGYMNLRVLCGLQAISLAFSLGFPLPGFSLQQGNDSQPTNNLKTKRTPSQAELRLARQVRDQLQALPYFTVFDNLAFGVEGDAVELTEQVTR